MRRFTNVLIAAVVLVFGGFALTAEDPESKWDPSGTWISATAAGNWIIEFIPLDPAGNRYSYSGDGISDPRYGGPITQQSDYHGECVRTGNNSIQCTLIDYLGTADYEVYAISVSYETRERLPDGTIHQSGENCAYGSWQDPFGDEPPFFGCRPLVYLTPLTKMPVRKGP